MNNYILPRPRTHWSFQISQLWIFAKTRQCKEKPLWRSDYWGGMFICPEIISHNKTPGVYGLLVEFYLCFWNEISNPLVDCLNHRALLGELSISQRQGIISLIPKKNKVPLHLKNCRPISLLNIDYKLAMKCTAKRLEKVLLHLIVRDQTGYTRDRFIGKNIRLISDIVKQNEKEEGVILIFLEWFWKSLLTPWNGDTS